MLSAAPAAPAPRGDGEGGLNPPQPEGSCRCCCCCCCPSESMAMIAPWLFWRSTIACGRLPDGSVISERRWSPAPPLRCRLSLGADALAQNHASRPGHLSTSACSRSAGTEGATRRDALHQPRPPRCRLSLGAESLARDHASRPGHLSTSDCRHSDFVRGSPLLRALLAPRLRDP